MFSVLRKRFSSTTLLQVVKLQRLFTKSLSYGSSNDGKPTFVHPTAIVHPDAVIGQGTSIGPFCTVGSYAKLGNACQLHPGSHVFGNTELGECCIVMTGAVIGEDHPGRTVIGRNNLIGHHAVVGVKCQDLKYKPGDECFLFIGNNNAIREYCSIHRSSKSSDQTVIGDRNLIMGSCHIAHDCKVGNNNIFANNTLFAGHVVIEDNTHTAGGTVVHQFCHIGSFSFIGGGSVVQYNLLLELCLIIFQSGVTQDVPRYMMVTGERAEIRGLNLEGLRRHGFSNEEIRKLRRVYGEIFMPTGQKSGSFEDRLVEMNEELCKSDAICSMLQSIRDSFDHNRRGICKFRSWNHS